MLLIFFFGEAAVGGFGLSERLLVAAAVAWLCMVILRAPAVGR